MFALFPAMILPSESHWTHLPSLWVADQYKDNHDLAQNYDPTLAEHCRNIIIKKEDIISVFELKLHDITLDRLDKVLNDKKIKALCEIYEDMMSNEFYSKEYDLCTDYFRLRDFGTPKFGVLPDVHGIEAQHYMSFQKPKNSYLFENYRVLFIKGDGYLSEERFFNDNNEKILFLQRFSQNFVINRDKMIALKKLIEKEEIFKNKFCKIEWKHKTTDDKTGQQKDVIMKAVVPLSTEKFYEQCIKG